MIDIYLKWSCVDNKCKDLLQINGALLYLGNVLVNAFILFNAKLLFHLALFMSDVPNGAWQVRLLPSNLEDFEVPGYWVDVAGVQHVLSPKPVSMQNVLEYMCLKYMAG